MWCFFWYPVFLVVSKSLHACQIKHCLNSEDMKTRRTRTHKHNLPDKNKTHVKPFPNSTSAVCLRPKVRELELCLLATTTTTMMMHPRHWDALFCFSKGDGLETFGNVLDTLDITTGIGFLPLVVWWCCWCVLLRWRVFTRARVHDKSFV